MKHFIAFLMFACATAHAQLVPTPAANYASSPISRITTPDGQIVTITAPNLTSGARANNALGGVVDMPPSLTFFVNYAALMKPVVGANTIRITSSTDPGTAAAQDIVGAFRTDCIASHMGRFDPLVGPGRAVFGHLHTFFGNGDLNGLQNDQTLGNLPSFGRSTCAGGIANRSAYWVPSMIDTTTGRPVMPFAARVYYKHITDYRGKHPYAVIAPPPGLRMIAGTPTATAPQKATTWKGGTWDVNSYVCAANGMTYDHIPTAADIAATPASCASPDDTISMEVQFPQCWDGLNLDSPGHQAHMAYEDWYSGCPPTHPVMIPMILYKIDYTIKSLGGQANLPNIRLSADNYPMTLPGGYAGHGDWINGWNQQIMQTWVENCLHSLSDCHNDVLDKPTTTPHRIMCAATSVYC